MTRTASTTTMCVLGVGWLLLGAWSLSTRDSLVGVGFCALGITCFGVGFTRRRRRDER
ncbi:hypothetical protein [Microbacterium aquimaris]|uniref:DUF2530 domain-containing protein n=1 Tax=Microbacterium aquimaris TaxID=459816 RepID=A0ABU5N5B4_9MICO|nr:hypothetical protein [Microbacterium aquimaris]MDZ8161278.1 hypothetical protein [Microbacterium aquimaris]